jgi:peptidoglycan/xylan/chitin deacetylase (PgdA/CDA1 family)
MEAVAFLMYHELELPGRDLCQSDPGYTRYIVTAFDFESQMLYLKGLGFEGVSVGRAIEFNSGSKVAITFDDGCETDLITAAPVLTRLGFRATFYATGGFLGQRGYMSTAQLRELSDAGFEIGCHSMTHPYLSDLDSAGLHREIVGAKAHLEQIIGRKVEHFSCPGGRFDNRVVEIAKQAGFRTLATSRPHLNHRNSDLHRLGRNTVLRHTTKEQVGRMCEGRGLWMLRLQDIAQTTAKRALGNRRYDQLRAILLGGSRPR